MDYVITWLALAIFFGLVFYMGGFKAILGGLDSRGARIKAELDQAQALRREAEALLQSFTAKRAAAEKEAEAIVAEAKAEAERVRVEQEARLADFVARRTAQAEQRIKQAEASAAADVRAAAADAAVALAAEIMKARSAGSAGDALIAKGLADVKARLN
jgi:F-type H+-transporting ATPase subunit b